MGLVVGVYLAVAGGLAMRPVQSAVALAGQGLLGDRYQTGTGQWCYDRRLYDDVTLIASEALDAAGAENGVYLQGGAARRNVSGRLVLPDPGCALGPCHGVQSPEGLSHI